MVPRGIRRSKLAWAYMILLGMINAWRVMSGYCTSIPPNCMASSPLVLDDFVLVKVKGIPSLITSQEIQTLASIVQKSYSCGYSLRVISNVTVVKAAASFANQSNQSTVFTWTVRIQGTSYVCQTGLFDHAFSLQRRLQPVHAKYEGPMKQSLDALNEITRDISLTESDDAHSYLRRRTQTTKISNNVCYCLPPTQADFAKQVNRTVQTYIMQGSLVGIQEVIDVIELQTVPGCDATTTTSWEVSIVIDIVGAINTTCANTIASLAGPDFVFAYNNANTLNPNNCDPYFHVATGASVQIPSTINGMLVVGKTSLVLTVNGTCHGCTANDTSIFDTIVGNRSLMSRSDLGLGPGNSRTLLQESSNQCLCPVGAIPQGVSQSELLAALSLPSCLPAEASSVAQVDVMNCSEFTGFQALANVTLAVGGNGSLTNNELMFLQTGFVDTYNGLATQFCDPTFRTVAAATIVTVSSAQGRRRDREGVRNLQSFNLSQTLTDGSSIPSSLASDAPSQAPTSQNSGSLSSLLFLVTGSCSGCASTTGGSSDLFNYVSRRLEHRTDDGDETAATGGDSWMTIGHRRGQASFNGTGQCFCQRGAIPGPPTLSNFRQAYNDLIMANARLFPNVLGVSQVQQPSSGFNLSAFSISHHLSIPPSSIPNKQSTISPTLVPIVPSRMPLPNSPHQQSQGPSEKPSSPPSIMPSKDPQWLASNYLSHRPSLGHSHQASVVSSTKPSLRLFPEPSAVPSGDRSAAPSKFPAKDLTKFPSVLPTQAPGTTSSKLPPTMSGSSFQIPPGGAQSKRPSKTPSVAPNTLLVKHPIVPSPVASNHPSLGPTKQQDPTPSRGPSIFLSPKPVQNSLVSSEAPSVSPSKPSASINASPTKSPTAASSALPSKSPTRARTTSPSKHPTAAVIASPTKGPTMSRTTSPSQHPIADQISSPSKPPRTTRPVSPSKPITTNPKSVPSESPVSIPATSPVGDPHVNPTTSPSNFPTKDMTPSPSKDSSAAPTRLLSNSAVADLQPSPSEHPTALPTRRPDRYLSTLPTYLSTKHPTAAVSNHLTEAPTRFLSQHVSPAPTRLSTRQPTERPTLMPSTNPSTVPKMLVTNRATALPSEYPTEVPFRFNSRLTSPAPTMLLPAHVTEAPTVLTNKRPTALPILMPASHPTAQPSKPPTDTPALLATSHPTEGPSKPPTEAPTWWPTRDLTKVQTALPSISLTKFPTRLPTSEPKKVATRLPTKDPTNLPTRLRTKVPTKFPTRLPTKNPTQLPTKLPTTSPTEPRIVSKTNSPTCDTDNDRDDHNFGQSFQLVRCPTWRRGL